MPELTIGGVAKAVGVNVETIRFYQRSGLIAAPERPMGSIRRYGHSEIERVRFIKRAQRLGFTLAEVRMLLTLEDGTDCAKAKSVAKQKLTKVQGKIGDLQRIEAALHKLVKACARRRGKVCCPLIAGLREGKP